MNVRVVLGIGLLLVAAAIVGVWQFAGFGGPAPIVVRGYYGGEKTQLLANPEVQRILSSRYGITVQAKSAGSTEMVSTIALKEEDDFLWPSNSVSVALYKENPNNKLVASENIFNSPLVIYSWAEITDALIRKGIVEKRGETYVIVKFQEFIDLMNQGKRWSDIGLTSIQGKIVVRTTDPNYSNSGLMFCGLMAGMLNGGETPDDVRAAQLERDLSTFFSRLGYMEQKSNDLFQQYLTTGAGARPLVAGYESQLIEFAIQNPAIVPQIKSQVRVLYPMPTVWSSHPFVARTANGKRLLEALKDPEIQAIAWKQHGFRSGVPGIANNPADLPVSGVPNSIDSVIDMPSWRAMERMLQAIRPNSN
jgi:hypothetical protein